MIRLDSSNWKDFIQQVADFQRQLSDDYPFGTVLKKSTSLLTDYSITVTDEMENISNSYHMMSDYMLRGYQDSQRDHLYRQLVRSLYRVLSDVSLQTRMKFDTSLAPLLSEGLEIASLIQMRC